MQSQLDNANIKKYENFMLTGKTIIRTLKFKNDISVINGNNNDKNNSRT